MEGTMEFGSGTYVGEISDGLPHGNGHYSYISRSDMDGLDSVFIHHKRGVWTDGVLSGVVWEYRYEEDVREEVREECSLRDGYGLTLLGVNRDGKMIGILADQLSERDACRDRDTLCRDGDLRWGWAKLGGRVFVGQFVLKNEFVPHGFCIEFDGDRVVRCGAFEMGERKGVGVVFTDDADSRFKMEYQFI